MNLDKLQTWLQEQNLDLAYISNPITIAYFTGYEMEPHERIFSLVAFKDADPFVFTPALNVEEAKASEWDGDVYGYLDSENPWALMATFHHSFNAFVCTRRLLKLKNLRVQVKKLTLPSRLVLMQFVLV